MSLVASPLTAPSSRVCAYLLRSSSDVFLALPALNRVFFRFFSRQLFYQHPGRLTDRRTKLLILARRVFFSFFPVVSKNVFTTIGFFPARVNLIASLHHG